MAAPCASNTSGASPSNREAWRNSKAGRGSLLKPASCCSRSRSSRSFRRRNDGGNCNSEAPGLSSTAIALATNSLHRVSTPQPHLMRDGASRPRRQDINPPAMTPPACETWLLSACGKRSRSTLRRGTRARTPQATPTASLPEGSGCRASECRTTPRSRFEACRRASPWRPSFYPRPAAAAPPAPSRARRARLAAAQRTKNAVRGPLAGSPAGMPKGPPQAGRRSKPDPGRFLALFIKAVCHGPGGQSPSPIPVNTGS